RYQGGAPLPPTVTTLGASGISISAATVAGTVNANGFDATVTFEYGPTDSYGSVVPATPSPVTSGDATAVGPAISGLTPHTTYHYRATAVNSNGTAHGADASFATPNSQPVAGNDAASVLGGNTVGIDVLANDSDADGDSLTAQVGAPAHGTVSFSSG